MPQIYQKNLYFYTAIDRKKRSTVSQSKNLSTESISIKQSFTKMISAQTAVCILMVILFIPIGLLFNKQDLDNGIQAMQTSVKIHENQQVAATAPKGDKCTTAELRLVSDKYYWRFRSESGNEFKYKFEAVGDGKRWQACSSKEDCLQGYFSGISTSGDCLGFVKHSSNEATIATFAISPDDRTEMVFMFVADPARTDYLERHFSCGVDELSLVMDPNGHGFINKYDTNTIGVKFSIRKGANANNSKWVAYYNDPDYTDPPYNGSVFEGTFTSDNRTSENCYGEFINLDTVNYDGNGTFRICYGCDGDLVFELSFHNDRPWFKVNIQRAY